MAVVQNLIPGPDGAYENAQNLANEQQSVEEFREKLGLEECRKQPKGWTYDYSCRGKGWTGFYLEYMGKNTCPWCSPAKFGVKEDTWKKLCLLARDPSAVGRPKNWLGAFFLFGIECRKNSDHCRLCYKNVLAISGDEKITLNSWKRLKNGTANKNDMNEPGVVVRNPELVTGWSAFLRSAQV